MFPKKFLGPDENARNSEPSKKKIIPDNIIWLVFWNTKKSSLFGPMSNQPQKFVRKIEDVYVNKSTNYKFKWLIF